MSLEGSYAVQTAVLNIVSRKNAENGSQAKSIFADMLLKQLAGCNMQGFMTNAQTGSALIDTAGSDMSTLMLLSLLGGKTGMVPTGLGNAISAARYTMTGTSGDETYSLEGLVIPDRPSRPVTPAITSHMHNRSAQRYTNVIAQFSVETSRRYAVNKKGTGDTYCNIFVWDVTSAMGAQIPYYYDPKTGAPMTYPDVKGAMYMSANRMYNWLHQHGARYGWHEVSAEQAQMLANQGKPVVASLKRTGMSGHVQMVCPSKDGVYDPKRGVTIAQAGRNLTSYRAITSIYSKSSLGRVKYFAHA